jgi:hypothetical protein
MSWRGTSGHYKARWTAYRPDRRCRALGGQGLPPHRIHPTLSEHKRDIREMSGQWDQVYTFDIIRVVAMA